MCIKKSDFWGPQQKGKRLHLAVNSVAKLNFKLFKK